MSTARLAQDLDLEKGVSQSEVKAIFTKNLGDNLVTGIPNWFFNFWWRFINIVDVETDSDNLRIALREESYKIAVPLTVGSGVLTLLLSALRSSEVRELVKEGKHREAISQTFIHMAKNAKKPETIFEAIYTYATSLGWAGGYATFTHFSGEYASSFLYRMSMNAVGAVLGNFAGAIAIGAIWGAGSLVLDCYFQSNNESRPSVKERCSTYVKSCLKELPGTAAWSLAVDVAVVERMMKFSNVSSNSLYKYLSYILDSAFVATASSLTDLAGLVIEKSFSSPKAQSGDNTTINGEQAPLLPQHTSAGINYSSFATVVSEDTTGTKKPTVDSQQSSSIYQIGQTLFDATKEESFTKSIDVDKEKVIGEETKKEITASLFQ